MRRNPRRLLAPTLLLTALVLQDESPASEAAAPPGPGAPSPQGVCPAIDEDFVLCSSDPWSGNCAQFVAAAGRLAQLYQIQVDDTPERTPLFLSTNWWGCGEATLGDMKGLLLRIGTPEARALLAQTPFSRLPAPTPEVAPSPPAPGVAPDCEGAPTPDARDACAASELASARVAYRRTLEACKVEIAAPLRSTLEGSEQAWEQGLPAQCDAAALEYDQPRLRAFARSQCLSRAMRERARGMLAAHPECGPSR